MPLLLVLIFIVVPLAELYVIYQVALNIGILWTVLILFADSIIGSMLLRSQGRLAWRRFNEATAAGRIPAKEVVDGALIIFGGAFLIAPGFITDIFGILFLLPPTRALFRRTIVSFFTKRTVVGFVGSMGAREYNARRGSKPSNTHANGNGDVVEGTAEDLDEPRLGP
jgi:UPF0716 protein FxsA